MSSILTDVKKILGINAEVESFDIDIIMHINTAFSVLNQLGVGPDVGFQIVDSSAEWEDFLGGDPRKNDIKTYLYLRVRAYFDPPATSYLIAATERQIQELEWRLVERREVAEWVDPNQEELDLTGAHVLDGGDP